MNYGNSYLYYIKLTKRIGSSNYKTNPPSCLPSNMSVQSFNEIQNSINEMNASISALMNEVAQLSAPQSRPVMKTSIPLLPTQPVQPYHRVAKPPQKGRRPYGELRQNTDVASKPAHNPIPLSALLKTNEEVTFFVYVGKDEQGQPIRTTATSTFDGTNLKVTACELVSSLVGLETQKPGEILYKFIDELKNGGHIKRTFSVAPWKLCFVTRDGAEVTLDQLRSRLE